MCVGLCLTVMRACVREEGGIMNVVTVHVDLHATLGTRFSCVLLLKMSLGSLVLVLYFSHHG